MAVPFFSDRARLKSIRAVLEHVGTCLDSGVSVRLWDGSVVPLGPDADPKLCLTVRGPGVIGSLLRRPTLDNLLTHYAAGRLDPQGADLYTFVERARVGSTRGKLRGIGKGWLAWKLLPFLFCPPDRSRVGYSFADEAGVGAAAPARANKDFVKFHYDVGNEFYELFLGEQMQYTCSYFADPDVDLEASQEDKLEMICRKLRLRPGEKLLDLGCGWGGLICYAAQHHGVKAHGVNLSRAQVEYIRAKIRRLGLGNRVSVEQADAQQVRGGYDKIACIGMFEHLGIDNYPRMLDTMYAALRDRGLLLVHMICRGAKPAGQDFRKSRPEHRLFRKYIFPGGELGNVGQLVQAMEAARFEVHDVEGWREHYVLTLKHWSQRLAAREEEAVRLVGAERYRMWLAYLVGMGFGFADGTLRLFQALGSKHAAKGPSGMPPTREHLYADPLPSVAECAVV